MWRLLTRMGSFPWVYRFCEPAGRVAFWLSFLLIAGWLWGLLIAPADYLQGNSYRIIFLHVPSAFMAQTIYASMAVAGVIGLVWRMKMAEVAIRAVLPIGAAMTFLALVSGAIWGKPTWGAWWVWDARLTSMLILMMLYLGLMALDSSGRNSKSTGRALCLLSVVGALNLPIIKYSVEWWHTLHQPASIKFTGDSTIAPEMLWPLLVSIAGLYALCAWLFFTRLQSHILITDRKKKWVKELVDGI